MLLIVYCFYCIKIILILQICQSSLCDTLRLLGCFSTQTKITEMDMIPTMNYHNVLISLFTGSILEPVFPDNMPKTLGYACLLLRLLYDVALDSFDKPSLANVGIRSPSHKQNNMEVHSFIRVLPMFYISEMVTTAVCFSKSHLILLEAARDVL